MGKKCIRCGDHGFGLYIFPDGTCENCRRAIEKEKNEKRNEEIRANNYHACLNGTARPGVMRIYRAFVSKYPDALITGIGVLGDDKKLLVYLDGEPAYYVTFNPLTNSVDLVKYGVVSTSSIRDAAPQNKSYDLATCWSVLALLYGIFLLLFSYIGAFAGIISSLIALCGCISKTKTAIILGGCLLFLSVVLAFPYSILNIGFMIALIASAQD